MLEIPTDGLLVLVARFIGRVERAWGVATDEAADMKTARSYRPRGTSRATASAITQIATAAATGDRAVSPTATATTAARVASLRAVTPHIVPCRVLI